MLDKCVSAGSFPSLHMKGTTAWSPRLKKRRRFCSLRSAFVKKIQAMKSIWSCFQRAAAFKQRASFCWNFSPLTKTSVVNTTTFFAVVVSVCILWNFASCLQASCCVMKAAWRFFHSMWARAGPGWPRPTWGQTQVSTELNKASTATTRKHATWTTCLVLPPLPSPQGGLQLFLVDVLSLSRRQSYYLPVCWSGSVAWCYAVAYH